MIDRPTRLLAVAATLAVTVAMAGAVPTSTAAAKADTVKTQKMVVKWNGKKKRKKLTYEKRISVPGIGVLSAVCRPNDIKVRIIPSDGTAETQMWLAKYEDKNFDDRADSVAVKNVRVYRYANADDDGKGGTGRSSHEGLNIRGNIENRNVGGYAYGVISERPGRNKPAGGADLPSATGFKLTWGWNGFAYPKAYRSCKIKVKTMTLQGPSVGLNWHGEDDAAGHTTTSRSVSGLGDLTLSCATGSPNVRDLAIRPDGNGAGASIYVEEITGEGAIDQHVEGYWQSADVEDGSISGVDLPGNGMLRIKYRGQWWLVSSYMVTNDNKPWRNVCEVAAARVPA